MLHGRRPTAFHHSTRRPHARKRHKVRMINSHLQAKYSTLVGVGTALLVALFSAPIWYHANQNTQIFMKIAYDTHSGLVSHLEREQMWTGILIVFGIVAAGTIAAWTLLRVTTLILGPLVQIDRHMQKVIRGDLSSYDFPARQDDEKQELTNTYAYLYRTLRVQTEKELKYLEQIVVDERDFESQKALNSLIKIKRKQLGISAETSASNALFQDSRRVS